MLGDSIQQGLTQDDYSVTGAVIVVGAIAVLQVLTSYASFRLPFLRPVLEGQPIVVVEDGRPIEKNLNRERISIEELAEEMRKQQIASLDEVQWAVLETGGSISFIKKSDS